MTTLKESQERAREFRRRLLKWYAGHRRDLPWRHDVTPYRVWISEIMLQQTVVGTVAARFEAWMERFPDVASLARASEREVLAAWEGLGYYRRAQGVRRAAAAMVERHGGCGLNCWADRSAGAGWVAKLFGMSGGQMAGSDSCMDGWERTFLAPACVVSRGSVW